MMLSIGARASGLCAVTAFLVGCTGTPSQLALPAAGITAAFQHDRSWMAPNVSGENLLYISDPSAGGVFVYTYRPLGMRYVGFIVTGAEAGSECVDKAQNIWVTQSAYVLDEYAHGGTAPIAVLGDPAGVPISCSFDPTTGNLAVVSYPVKFGGPTLAIYRKARGKPTLYSDTGYGMTSCTYDHKGNLFINVTNDQSNLVIAELPKGGSSFTNISLNQFITSPWTIQWDGKYLAVGDQAVSKIYRFAISGSSGTKVGTVELDGSSGIYQFFIDRNTIIVPNAPFEQTGYVSTYHYPKGGQPFRTLKNFSQPAGAAVSRAL